MAGHTGSLTPGRGFGQCSKQIDEAILEEVGRLEAVRDDRRR